jgi:hypothetical protein
VRFVLNHRECGLIDPTQLPLFAPFLVPSFAYKYNASVLIIFCSRIRQLEFSLFSLCFSSSKFFIFFMCFEVETDIAVSVTDRYCCINLSGIEVSFKRVFFLTGFYKCSSFWAVLSWRRRGCSSALHKFWQCRETS